jgi:hypothetical protein
LITEVFFNLRGRVIVFVGRGVDLRSGVGGGKGDMYFSSLVGAAEISSALDADEAGNCASSRVGEEKTSSGIVCEHAGSCASSLVGEEEISSGIVCERAGSCASSLVGEEEISSAATVENVDRAGVSTLAWSGFSVWGISVDAAPSGLSDVACVSGMSSLISTGGVSGSCKVSEDVLCLSCNVSTLAVPSSSSTNFAGSQGSCGNSGIDDCGCMRRVRRGGNAGGAGIATTGCLEVMSKSSSCASTSSRLAERVWLFSVGVPQWLQNCALSAISAWQWVHLCIRCSSLLSDA